MSSKAEHDAAGFTLGALIAVLHTAATSKNATPMDWFAAALGGGLGGLIGSRLPDVIEPATHSWHRSTAHSVAVTGGVAYAGATHAASLAAQFHQVADESGNEFERALSRFGAGAAVGAPTGYVSHILLDSQTPRGIPLLTRGL